MVGGDINQPKVSFPLRLIRAYGHHSPISRGKRWAYQRALEIWELPQDDVVIRDRGGRFFCVNLGDRIYRDLFFQGLYEPEVSWLVGQLVGPGHVVVDAGANFGWFTLLFADLVGPTGAVHAFEPVRATFDGLQLNLRLNGEPSQVRCCLSALGERNGEVEMFTFAELGPAYSSLSTLGLEEYSVVKAEMITLDSYWAKIGTSPIRLLKIDVEGSELSVLRGADSILDDDNAPLVLFEINSETASAFGYTTQDLLDHMTPRGYQFFRNKRRSLHSVDSAEECHHGDMILATKNPNELNRLL